MCRRSSLGNTQKDGKVDKVQEASSAQVSSDEDVVMAPTNDANTSFIFRKLLHKDAKLSKLKTHEDKYHIHKTFGILSVLSFFYRYAYVYNVYGNLGFSMNFHDIQSLQDEKQWVIDAFTLTVHTLLAFSSIIFRVPKKRLPNKPMVIYEEYRQHAMTFTARCTLVWLASACLPQGRLGGVQMQQLGVLSMHLLADRITSIHGKIGNTAVRANSKDMSGFYRFLAKFYSFYQFLAIASHLLVTDRPMDMAYNAIIAIQSSAFLMTLYRKRIIRGTTHMVIYSFCLIVSAFHIMRVIGAEQTALTVSAFLLRINLPRGKLSSKYFIWTLFLLVANSTWLMQVFAGVTSIDQARDTILGNADALNVAKGTGIAATVFAAFTIEEAIRA